MNQRLQDAQREPLKIAGLAIAAIGLSGIVGLCFDIQWLSAFVPNGSPLSFNTAIALVWLGLGVISLSLQYRKTAVCFGALVLLLGVAHACGRLLSAKELVNNFARQFLHLGVRVERTGVSPTNTALLILAGLTILELARRLPRRRIIVISGAAFFGVSSSRLVGYIAGTDAYDWGHAFGMSFPTAIAFAVFGVTLLRLTRHLGAKSGSILSLSASAITLLLSCGFVMMNVNAELIATGKWVEHSLGVQSTLARFVSSMARMDAATRAYALTGKASFIESANAHHAVAIEELEKLDELTIDNPAQHLKIQQLRPLVAEKVAFTRDLARGRQETGTEFVTTALLSENPGTLDRFSDLANAIDQEESRLLVLRRIRNDSLAHNAWTVLIIGFLLAIVLVGTAFNLTVKAKQSIEALNENLEQGVLARTAELSKAQHRLKTILQSSPIVFWAIDANGIFTAMEGKGMEGQGYEPRQLLGTSLFEFAKDEPEITTITRRALKGEISTAVVSSRGRWFENHYAQIREHSGEISGLVAVSTDITSRKEAERLVVSEQSAKETSRLKSEFLANMSHEIRTPMNGVLGMAALLNQTPLTQDQREMTGIIQNSAENLLTIIGDILDFSKIEAGRLEIEATEIDPRAVIEETLTVLAPRAAEKNLELVCDIDPAFPGRLKADGVRIRQIITNFTANAIKFTERGEVRLEARSIAGEGECAWIRITVSDTGIGISKESSARLFQAFTQADGSITRRFGGTGLGLTISRQLVQLMGGRVGFESEVGQGSIFWFELGLPRVGARGVGVPPLRERHSALVVEDNPSNAAALLRELDAFGIDASVAQNGREALTVLLANHGDQNPFEAVLIDERMPEMSGLQLAEKIRAEKELAALPLILLSPAGQAIGASNPAMSLFSSVLAKPVRQHQLRRSLKSVLAPNETTLGSNSPLKLAAEKKRRALNILVAEDDRVNRLVAAGILSHLGHRVEFAGTGVEVLTRLADKKYNLILMDCHMPELDGYETTRKIRNSEKSSGRNRVPIVALTASAMAVDRTQCLEAGMDDFVTKPIVPEALQSILNRWAV